VKTAPKKIQKSDVGGLTITWPDGDVCSVPPQTLRDECPCAHCKGENILGKVYKPKDLQVYTDEMYMLEGVEMVGNYAISVQWKDGHATGIYTWEYLRLLCEESE